MMNEEFNAIIKSGSLKDLTVDLVELCFDKTITKEVISEIPILKSFLAIFKVHSTISDYLFIKKSLNVLLELKDINSQDRADFLKELSNNGDKGIENLLMAIDKIDNSEKCKVFGRLCSLKARKQINVDEFKRLTKLIQDAYLSDLSQINEFKENKSVDISNWDYSSLISLGLISQGGSGLDKEEANKNRFKSVNVSSFDFGYHPTKLGKLLLFHFEYLFPEWRIE